MAISALEGPETRFRLGYGEAGRARAAAREADRPTARKAPRCVTGADSLS